MVLGLSLRRTGTRHDLVLLHTEEVLPNALDLLSKAGWNPRQVEPVCGVSELYNHGEPRFVGVFTKLRVFGLTEYEKVLMMDIDTLVLHNMDELFCFEAPAAMIRGSTHSYKKGDPIDGSYFFGGSNHWGQSSGINAGLMLLAPNEDEMWQMLKEVRDRWHPSHIRGNGPEQDYLSRFYADSWTHIPVEYNFQLHQMYYALHPDDMGGERARFLTEQSDGQIRMLHYSGKLKPWSRYLLPQYANGDQVEAETVFLKDTLEAFPGFWMWVEPDPETWKHKAALDNMVMDSTGRLRRVDWEKYSSEEWKNRDRTWNEGEDEKIEDQYPLGEVVEWPIAETKRANAIVEMAMRQWNETYASLSSELGFQNLIGEGSLAEFARKVCSGTGSDVSDQDSSVFASQSPAAGDQGGGWSNCGGWWVDRPVMRGRVSAVAGNVPEPFVSFSANCKSMLDLRGDSAKGLHVVSITAEGRSAVLNGDDLSVWMAHVPTSAVILVAVVGFEKEEAESEIARLEGSGCFGLPKSLQSLPSNCNVFVAVGRKDDSEWSHTMAAADYALATLAM
eukprot:TRINITY_DN111428_c0_g1_i1.p1 TRINITY_DN111428_c0_g1~~TRINITY_DN111428_c0_g1_i1.p1  ORF type:complete len:594 (+),score=100.82 TRINITY_DN111428_c0_g1_i1:103-1782(+)